MTRGEVKVRLRRARGMAMVVEALELFLKMNRRLERDERRIGNDG